MANGYDEIRIQGENFRVPLRYSAGHVLNENEANTLNQTLHENLRNNFAKKVVEGKEAGLTLEVLQQQLDDYAADYKFGERSSVGFRGDPVMTLAMNAAREIIRRAIKEQNFDADQWPATKVSAAAKQLLDSQGEDGSIISRARKQIEEERREAAAIMSEVKSLLDGSAPVDPAQ